MNNVYAVFDSCSAVFGDPFIAANDAVAKRMFDHTISNSSIPKYIRDDSVLYGIGYFDQQTGYFTCDVPPYVVSRGASVVVSDVSRETSASPEVKNCEE